MREWTENDMRLAIQMVADGSTIRKAAAAFGIARTTL
jgi:hypothetical protein